MNRHPAVEAAVDHFFALHRAYREKQDKEKQEHWAKKSGEPFVTSLEDDMMYESFHARKAIRMLRLATAGSKSLTSENVAQMVGGLGRKFGPAVIWELHVSDCIDPEAYPHMVQNLWSWAELPGQWLDERQWRQLWQAAGFTIDGEHAERPTNTITLYRGAWPSFKRGWAWTTNPHRAMRFAEVRGGWDGKKAHVYTAEVPPDRLMAYISAEEEWIVDAKGLAVKSVPQKKLLEIIEAHRQAGVEV